MSTETSTAVVEKKPSAKRTFQELVDSDKFKSQITAALPKHLTADRFIRVLMTATIKNPQLLECTQESMFKGIFDCAAIGLELDGRRAHLVPLRNRKKQGQPLEANLWLDYKGIAELVMRSGTVSNIHADVVCENDDFVYDRGELKAHKIDFKKERGEMYAAYCIIRMKDGGEKVEVMGKAEIDRIRQASPGASADPWTKHYNEQAKKTVFKRASKWVPLSAEIKNVLDAEHDEEPINVTPKPTMAGLIGAATETTVEPVTETASEPTSVPPDDANHGNEAPLPTAPPPEAAGKKYTAEERETILKEVETLMLDNSVTEAKVMTYAHANNLAVKGQDEVGALTTVALDALRAIIPTFKKK